MSQSTVLVTGGAGYIGSVAVAELLAAGYAVVVYDNLSAGHRAAVTVGAELVEGDLADIDRLSATLRDRRIDAVMHFAGSTAVGESVANPANYYHNNLMNSLRLVEALRTADVQRVVFSSTAAVYGEPRRVPIEETDPTDPTNPYGDTKLAFERALRWHGAAYGLRYAALRYFNAAGATERLGEDHRPEAHLIPLVIQVALGRRAQVAVFGADYPTPDGTCVRDYIHVVDLAQAHVLALRELDRRSVTFNLGNGSGFSVREVVELAREVTGHPIPAVEQPRRPGDPATRPCWSRARPGSRPSSAGPPAIPTSAPSSAPPGSGIVGIPKATGVSRTSTDLQFA